MSIVLSDEKFAEIGIITRSEKGSALTHEELDNNMKVALDYLAFIDVFEDSVHEYAAILAATPLVPGGDTIVESISGYAAVKLEGTANLGNIPAWNAGTGWIYGDGFDIARSINSGNGMGDLVIEAGDEYLVVASDNTVTFTSAGGSGAGTV